jgi:hypothetical protein
MSLLPDGCQDENADFVYKPVKLTSKGGLDAYAEWFAQQPIPIQQEYIKRGLGPEAREGDGNYTFEVNPDHQAYATIDPQYEDAVVTPIEQRTYTEDEVQEVVRRVVMAMQMTESPDALFQARCILIAFGIGDPPTETELAKQKGCSRQFVSKKVKRIQQMFNLAPSQFMRSEQACRAYADAWQRQRHDANQSSIPRTHKHIRGGKQIPQQAPQGRSTPHTDTSPTSRAKRPLKPLNAVKPAKPQREPSININTTTPYTQPGKSIHKHSKHITHPHTPPPPHPPVRNLLNENTPRAGS